MVIDKKVCLIAGIILLFGAGWFFFRDSAEIVFEEPVTFAAHHQSVKGALEQGGQKLEKEPEPVPEIAVHVAGNVSKPGVYLVPEGTRLDLVLQMAGAIDMQIIDKHFNRAARLSDGQKIYIPTAEEVAQLKAAAETSEQLPDFVEYNAPGNQSPVISSAGQGSGKININRASLSELMQLPGIGEVRGAEIIRYRENHGQFRTINDIMNVTGIGQATFDRIKELITV